MHLNKKFVVIGAGAAGLVVAVGLAKARKNVLLVDKGNWGGDCTNFGCIPSKSLIHISNTLHGLSLLHKLNILSKPPKIEAHNALSQMRRIKDEIREEEEPLALKELGLETLTGTATFLDPHTLKVTNKDQQTIVKSQEIILATGSNPYIPSLAGLDTVPFLTNETLFSLTEIPEHLVILGGGPMGCEMAQSFSRLGSKVTLIQHNEYLLPKEDKEASQLMASLFEEEGITLHLKCTAERVERKNHHILVYSQKFREPLVASHLLVSVGRRPDLEKLQLSKANVTYSAKGIPTDCYYRTNQRNIYAIGDAQGNELFTHYAEFQGRHLLKNLILPWPFRFKANKHPLIPRVTYVDPEIASVGVIDDNTLTSYTLPFTRLDRARCTGSENGFIKILTKKWSGQIMGATIVGPRAGEMLVQIITAMDQKIPIRKLANIIYPYPSFSLAVRKAADQYYTKTLLSLIKRI